MGEGRSLSRDFLSLAGGTLLFPHKGAVTNQGFFFLQRLVPVGEAVSSPCIPPRGVPADTRPLSAPVAAEEGPELVPETQTRHWWALGWVGRPRTEPDFPGWHRLLLWASVLSSSQSFLPPFPFPLSLPPSPPTCLPLLVSATFQPVQ